MTLNRPSRFRDDLLDRGLWVDIECLAQESTVRPRPPERRPRRPRDNHVQRQLPLEEVQQLIARYLAGATVQELADAFEVHRTTALTLLERNQIPRRGRVWTAELTDRAVALYADGLSCASIGRQLRVAPETVRKGLLAVGITLRRPGRSTWQLPGR